MGQEDMRMMNSSSSSEGSMRTNTGRSRGRRTTYEEDEEENDAQQQMSSGSSSRRAGSRFNNKNGRGPEQEEENEREEDEEEQDEEQEPNLEFAYANSVCHDMDPCDMCMAIVCPCVTYGEVIERLEPEESEGMWTTGCVVWAGILTLSAVAIEVPLLVPGACSWLPTTYFGGVLDARQLLLACAYFVPQCVCHLPLRYTLLGNEENIASACAKSVFCSCCSLSSLKALAREGNQAFDEQEASLGRYMPFAATLHPRERMLQAEEQAPKVKNQMRGGVTNNRQGGRAMARTTSYFEPERALYHTNYYYY
jgi:hypothetical protein